MEILWKLIERFCHKKRISKNSITVQRILKIFIWVIFLGFFVCCFFGIYTKRMRYMLQTSIPFPEIVQRFQLTQFAHLQVFFYKIILWDLNIDSKCRCFIRKCSKRTFFWTKSIRSPNKIISNWKVIFRKIGQSHLELCGKVLDLFKNLTRSVLFSQCACFFCSIFNIYSRFMWYSSIFAVQRLGDIIRTEKKFVQKPKYQTTEIL